MNCCENLRARPARQQCAHYIAVRPGAGRAAHGDQSAATQCPAPRAATSRLGRRFWRPAQVPSPIQRPNPPKAGRCTTPGTTPRLGRTSRKPTRPISPKTGRCATPYAQRPGLGEIGKFERRMRAILAQGLGSGETRARKIPAWESRREGPAHLPAKTSEALWTQKGDSLPKRDLAPKRGRFCAPEAEILPSKDDAPSILNNVPAWEGWGPAGSRWRLV